MDVTQKAQRAQILLRDPLLREAIDGLVAEQMAVFAGRAPVEAVTEARHIMWALEALEVRLGSYIDDEEVFRHRQNKVAPQ
jgi:hypothetical protein